MGWLELGQGRGNEPSVASDGRLCNSEWLLYLCVDFQFFIIGQRWGREARETQAQKSECRNDYEKNKKGTPVAGPAHGLRSFFLLVGLYPLA
jgi:hypothetical protein